MVFIARQAGLREHKVTFFNDERRIVVVIARRCERQPSRAAFDNGAISAAAIVEGRIYGAVGGNVNDATSIHPHVYGLERGEVGDGIVVKPDAISAVRNNLNRIAWKRKLRQHGGSRRGRDMVVARIKRVVRFAPEPVVRRRVRRERRRRNRRAERMAHSLA